MGINRVTLAVLPVSKAETLRILLEKEKINCFCEALHLTESTSSQAVRIQVADQDLENGFSVLEELLGKTWPVPGPGFNIPRQILVPVDFSSYSQKAAGIAFEIAFQLNAEMVFFHSYPNPIAYSVPFSDVYAFDTGLLVHLENAEKAARENMEAFLKNLVEKVSKERWNKISTEFLIKAGDASDDILSYTHQNRVILVVMGTQGKAGSEYDIIGSVTAEIISSSKIPVLAIPAETPDNITSVFHKVLYATNFDNKDFTAIETLMGILKPYHPELHCVHISKKGDPMWNLARLEGMKNILCSKYQKDTFKCCLINGEDILEEIEKYISENHIDLLALTTHRRSMLSRIFNPSIARKMLFHTTKPLLVFHA